ncbi:MAG: DMT family transporter [Paracoccaceae bacterium]
MKYGTGVILVVLAGLIWSTQGLAIRQIDSTDTWAILFWRSAGTAPALLLAISLSSGGRPAEALRRAGISGIVGGLGLVLAFAGSIYSMQATTIANAVFLFSASPFFAAVLGWLILGERVRGATWASIGLAVLGMFVMVREGLSAGALDGNIAALISALGFAAFTIALRWHRLEDMLPAVFLGAVFSMIVAAGVQGARGLGLGLSASDIGIAMAIGALVVGLGLSMYTIGSKGIPAAELTLLSQIEVLMSPVWVFFFLDERATAGTFLGGAILTAAVVFNGLSGAAAKARAA